MLTIEKIKQECIGIDMQNIDAGDTSIGTYVDGEFLQFRDSHDVELFYANISLKELLTIYSQYMGLSCYKSDEPKEYRESYSLDILTIINEL
tara:strand:+ start:1647 stop:1922 length:276 start_codon:yes stop_codon:yes gene_type:complete